MEPNENMIQYDFPLAQSSYIKVIGVGGGGGNAVNHMFRNGIEGVDFIVTNTDEQALMSSPVTNKIVLGKLGAGSKPEVARKAAIDHKEEIVEQLKQNTQMLFITAGMGGGTGTGAAPVIAELAKSIDLEDEEVNKILVVAVVTMPFSFEGRRRRNQALAGIEELRKHVDSILIINNDKLRDNGNMTLPEAYALADDVLLNAVRGIAEIITKESVMNTDFHDVNTVMQHSGTALMGTGVASGDNRAYDAIVAATTSELLNDNDIRGAQNVLLHIGYGSENPVRMDEITEITDYLTDLIGSDEADIIWGTGSDDSLKDELKITLIATGYETNAIPPKDPTGGKGGVKVGTIDAFPPVTPQPPHQPQGTGLDDMHLVSKPQQAEPVVPPVRQPEPMRPEGNKEPIHRVVPLEPEPVTPADSDSNDDSFINTHSNLDRMELRTHAPQSAYEPQIPVAPARPAVYNEPQTPVDTFPAYGEPQVMTATPVAPARPVAPPMSSTDRDVTDRAERIRRMNDLLRNDPEGGLKVERMGLDQLRQAAMGAIKTSSMSERVRTTLDASGNMNTSNSFLYDNPD